MPKPTNADLARVYGTTERQLARWKRDMAPLLDVAAMMLWFVVRQSMPDHLKTLGDDEREAMQEEINALAPEAASATVTPTGKTTGRVIKEPLQGAQHALRRLEEEETRLYKQLAEAAGNPALEAAIRKSWRETLLSLKQFDVLVEAGRRDTGEVVTRAQITPVLTTLVVWLRRAAEDYLNSICVQIADAETPQAVYALIAPTIRGSVGNAVDAAAGDGKLPGWIAEAMRLGL